MTTIVFGIDWRMVDSECLTNSWRVQEEAADLACLSCCQGIRKKRLPVAFVRFLCYPQNNTTNLHFAASFPAIRPRKTEKYRHTARLAIFLQCFCSSKLKFSILNCPLNCSHDFRYWSFRTKKSMVISAKTKTWASVLPEVFQNCSK